MRSATPDDAPAIGALIMDLLPFLTVDPAGQGAEAFIANVGVAAQQRYLAQENFRYHVALQDGALAGVVAVRDNGHLFHLFVQQALHGQGLGRRLWELARDEAIAQGNPGIFTVKASDHAAPMYARLGFAATGPRVEEHGVAYLPMLWERDTGDRHLTRAEPELSACPRSCLSPVSEVKSNRPRKTVPERQSP